MHFAMNKIWCRHITCAADEGRARCVTGLGSGTNGAERGLGRSLLTWSCGMDFSTVACGRPMWLREDGTALPQARDDGGPNALRGLELGTPVLQPVLEEMGRPLSGFALLAEDELTGRFNLCGVGVRSCWVCRLEGSIRIRFALPGRNGLGA